MKFKVGDRLILKDNSRMAARIGATCIVTGIEAEYIIVKWTRDNLSQNQSDGGYTPDSFELIERDWD